MACKNLAAKGEFKAISRRLQQILGDIEAAKAKKAGR
jgi:hypothetical protein